MIRVFETLAVTQGDWKWHHSIHRLSSYRCYIVTVVLSYIISEIKCIFHTTPAFDVPLGGSLSEYCHNVWHGKIRMVDLPGSEKQV